jgi:hypothetical protein
VDIKLSAGANNPPTPSLVGVFSRASKWIAGASEAIHIRAREG